MKDRERKEEGKKKGKCDENKVTDMKHEGDYVFFFSILNFKFLKKICSTHLYLVVDVVHPIYGVQTMRRIGALYIGW